MILIILISIGSMNTNAINTVKDFHGIAQMNFGHRPRQKNVSV